MPTRLTLKCIMSSIERHHQDTSARGRVYDESHTAKGHYSRLLLMAVLSFASMYVLMYAMVNAFANV